MRITVDTSTCVGAGQCALSAGELFDQDDDGVAIVLVDEPEREQWPAARRAASLCPAHAIAVTE